MEERLSIIGLLPEVVWRALLPGTPLDASVAVMAQMRQPILDRIANLDAAFDPLRAEEALVSEMARWLGLALEDAVDAAAARDLLREAADLHRRRGTIWALERYLSLACRAEGFRVREASSRPFHVVVRMPAGVEVHRRRIEAIVAREKPAHLSFEVLSP